MLVLVQHRRLVLGLAFQRDHLELEQELRRDLPPEREQHQMLVQEQWLEPRINRPLQVPERGLRIDRRLQVRGQEFQIDRRWLAA